MDTETSRRKLPAVVDRPSRCGANSNRRVHWPTGLALAAAGGVLAIALGVAVDQRWLTLGALTPLLLTLPCAVMMLMCMRGMNNCSNTETNRSPAGRQDNQTLP